jgi:ribose 5-phosphate isomerase A
MRSPDPRAVDRRAEELKRQAAEHAAQYIEDGMRLGLGTGSTVRHLIEHIAARREAGEWRSLVAVPTSRATEAHASERGIPLSTLDQHPALDLAIDGADEVDERLHLIKGLGGALLREKIVASASRRLVIIVDESKLVARLGSRVPLPVEVDPFGATIHLDFLRSLGADPAFRRDAHGRPLSTDGGHLVIDCRFPDGIDDPERVDRELHARPGILETGFFLGMTDLVVVAGESGAREIAARD